MHCKPKNVKVKWAIAHGVYGAYAKKYYDNLDVFVIPVRTCCQTFYIDIVGFGVETYGVG